MNSVYVKAMPVFFGGCVADLIRRRHTCTIERLIQEDEKRLDLTDPASLRDFLWRFNGSLLDVRQDILRRLPIIEVRRDALGRRLDQSSDHVLRRLDQSSGRVAAFLCDSLRELDDDDCKLIDEAFDDNLRNFSQHLMADKEKLWKLLTQSGPTMGLQAPARFTICLHM